MSHIYDAFSDVINFNIYSGQLIDFKYRLHEHCIAGSNAFIDENEIIATTNAFSEVAWV